MINVNRNFIFSFGKFLNFNNVKRIYVVLVIWDVLILFYKWLMNGEI